MDGVAGRAFPLAGSAPSVRLFAPMQQHISSPAPQSDKPTAAQAAAGRLQRASARQVAKAAQQQKRQAQARAAAAAKVGGGSAKRKKDEEDAADEDAEDGTNVNAGFVLAAHRVSPSLSSVLFFFSVSLCWKNAMREGGCVVSPLADTHPLSSRFYRRIRRG